MEPNYLLQNILTLLLPFGCYYLGIVLRKVVIPGKESPSLLHQCLLGIPVSLVVVAPMLPVLAKTYSEIPTLCVALGIIIEHGMLVNETATQHLTKLNRSS
jgi:hypothetical protein